MGRLIRGFCLRFFCVSFVGLFVVAFFVFALVGVPIVSADLNEFSASEKALSFLSDVANFDLSKYNVQTVFNRPYKNLFNYGIADWEIKYQLNSTESTLDVILVFRSDHVVRYNLYLYKGLPVYIQPIADNLDYLKGFLQRYQVYSNSPYLLNMRNMLDNIDDLNSVMVISENTKLTITSGGSTYISWTYTVNGVDISPNSVSFIFNSGGLNSFVDDWGHYPVGSTELMVSKEQAILIAKREAQNSTFVVGGAVVPTPNFTFVDQFNVATWFMALRDGKLYPIWDVKLALDKVYLNSVTGFQVKIWADTGQIQYLTSIGMLGVPSEDNSSLTPTPSFEPAITSSLIPESTCTISPSIIDVSESSQVPTATASVTSFSQSSIVSAQTEAHSSSGSIFGFALFVIIGVLVFVGVVVFVVRFGRKSR